MASRPSPVLPVLTSRIRHYGKNFHHPMITTRQRYTPYPARSDIPPISFPTSPVFPGSFMTLVQRILPKELSESATVGESSPQVRSAPVANQSHSVVPLLTPTIENDGLIPKPAGEAGRRVGGRGYNIEETLKWSGADMENMRVRFKNHLSIQPTHDEAEICSATF